MSAAKPRRLASVDAIRTHQRAWLDETRRKVAAGEPFAICNADDFEEIFTTFDIPALVINYWNSVITFSERKGPHFTAVLDDAGYEPANFAMGLAATLAPEEAPWGGLPKPAVIIGTTRDEAQLRVTELWARAFGCECIPIDFSWVSQFSHPLPEDWWNWHRSRSGEMVDPARVALRVAQLKGVIAHLETVLGRPFDERKFAAVMELLNEQTDRWNEAMDLIAAARPLPVALREQMAAYQTMWQRGTRENLALHEAYHEETRAQDAAGERAHPEERVRIYMATSGNDPAFHAYVRERWGAAIVSNRYSSIAPMYARDLGDDPLLALARRQLFLFDKEPVWEVHEARRWGAEIVIGLEPAGARPSRYRETVEAAGLTYIAIPRDADTPEIRALLDAGIARHVPE
jgi:hypothetical protein